jgi:hypothetical protein
MYEIDDNLKEFVESGVAVVVGTGDNLGRPEIAYGWAPRVLDDRTSVELFIDEARAEKTMANLRGDGRIAVTLAEPISYRSVQFKGKFLGSRPVDEPDRNWVKKHRDAFATTLALIGDPLTVIQALWLEDVVEVSLSVESAFNQTPGPEAGKPL